jgi:MFS transporter, DHA1 family, inner membrane transport protein
MPPRFSLTALMLGNLVMGIAVLAPAGMALELSRGLAVTIRDAGFLITAGAVVLCFGSPISAWLTSKIDRRLLLSATLLVLALGHLASAFAPDYFTLLAIRVAMLAVGALYTPQAASTAALLVSPERRAGAISFVFLGWSLATAIGIPLITLAAGKIGWRETYALLAVFAFAAFMMLALCLPSGFRGAPVSLLTWGAVARSRLIVLLLSITALNVCGFFTVITYLAPLLLKLANAGTEVTSLFFLIFGAANFVGNVIATRVVGAIGAFRTSVVALGSLLFGMVVWTLGASALPMLAAGVLFWGLGFSANNSMQQARLAAAAPELASASIALNTSAVYVGQAVGSYVGGFLIVRDQFTSMGWAAVGFLVVALFILAFTREAPRAMRAQKI